MEQFHDGHHVALRSRTQGTYLRADDDGSGISMNQDRASVHAAWTVHIHHVNAGDILMLHSAANGRYLATGPGWRRRHLLSGNRASIILRDLDQEVFPPVCWFAIRSGWGDDVLLRHCSWRFLRADDTKWNWNWNWNSTGVIADMFDSRRRAMWQWVVEAIPPRNSIPRPPNPSPSFGFFARRIWFRRLSQDNEIVWVWMWFTGRSALHLWNQIEGRMGFHPDPNSTMCVRAGTFGQLTPLVTDLPRNNATMVIFVLPPETLAGIGLTCPNVHAA